MLLRKVTRTIHMTQAYFNHPAVIDEVWAAHGRGVQIKFLFDYGQCHRASSCIGQKAIIAAFAAKGATEENSQEEGSTEAVVKLIEVPYKGVLHVKSWLLDETIYVGGSFNPTVNADSNSIEQLVIVNDQQEVEGYLQWFQDLWTSARKFSNSGKRTGATASASLRG